VNTTLRLPTNGRPKADTVPPRVKKALITGIDLADGTRLASLLGDGCGNRASTPGRPSAWCPSRSRCG
jgi:hypothetical protein